MTARASAPATSVLRRFGHGTGATSAVEFAMLAPVFCMVLAAAVDFSGALFVKFNLNGAVSAAANYTLLNAGNVSSGSGASLASNLAAVASSSYAQDWANSAVVVNNGPTMTRTAGVATAGGVAAAADSCYCPTPLGLGTVVWGTPTPCAAACSDGSPAGKFVTVTASRSFTPFFPAFGLFNNTLMTASTTVQVK